MNYEKYLSKTVTAIPPSGIRKFFDLADKYKDIISLGVGEPDFDTPWCASEAAIKSIQKGMTHYTSNSGLPALREQIAKYLNYKFGVDYDPVTEIFITVGASEAIYLALRAIINDGDEVVVPEPSYVSYQPSIAICGGKAVPAKCFVEDEFRLTAKNLEKVITPKTKALILPYPNNPTGAVMPRESLEQIAKVVKKHDLLVISDEIYCEMTYGEQRHTCFAEIDGMKERCVLINGFSKSFAMTGWRVGYACAPNEIFKQMLKIHQYIIMCASTNSQYAAFAALKGGFENDFAEMRKMIEEYDMRRRFLVARLNDMGLTCFEPKGAFYVFPCVKSTGMDGEEFASKLLEESRVAVVPGEAFGESGKDFIRISYAYSLSKLQKAIERIEEFTKKYKK
ncbi:MAG: aminotransferase class I/II-fold pyridoxal phosphate-dependent enzyme [Clostridia bacterium]|nr:aminotransferase class I/II-fold pyridoxal phosphate-dependent enzyme [Clostridia bacterium]MDE7328973.1 aminotransferase class I/II-fold pyridoxal phosphate-dependent enzyme [Clostridia bacterium]